MSKTLSTKKALVVFLAAITLAFAGLACTPATASASELTAGKMAQSVKSPAFRIAKNTPAPKVDARIASGAGKISVHASKVDYAQGYEFQISTSANFSKGVKTKRVKAYGTTFKGLKKGKKYYVRARAYQTSTNLCTKWSKKKSTKSGIAPGKSKITGAWKVVNSNSAELSDNIALLNRFGHCIKVTFSKKGNIVVKNSYNGSTIASGKWVASSKTTGYEYSNYKKTSKITLKNGRITWTDKGTGVQMILARA